MLIKLSDCFYQLHQLRTVSCSLSNGAAATLVHNRNLKISKALLKSQAHQGTSLFTSAATNQRGVFQRRVKRSSGPISRIPGGCSLFRRHSPKLLPIPLFWL